MKCKPKFTFVSRLAASNICGHSKPFLLASYIFNLFRFQPTPFSHFRLVAPLQPGYDECMQSGPGSETCLPFCVVTSGQHSVWWGVIPIPVGCSGQTSTPLLCLQIVNIPCVVFICLFSNLVSNCMNCFSDYESEQLVEVYQYKAKLHAIAIIKPTFPIEIFV